jgi:thiopurine S-methyltransferase
MDRDFWHSKWLANDIGFNQRAPNVHLQTFSKRLTNLAHGRVFVPLCGKSVDMLGLRKQGATVIGCEIDSMACEAFFEENEIAYTTRAVDAFLLFEAENIRIYCGDIFALTVTEIGKITHIYDRAALIALSPEQRQRYAKHLQSLSQSGTEMLLLTLDYQTSSVLMPPYPVSDDEISALYQAGFTIECLQHTENVELAGHLQARDMQHPSESIFYMQRH